MPTKIELEQISVASPCTASWDAMAGDDRARFCGQCSQHVYNLSAMTQEEAEALVMKREGRLCVRFYKRADGTMMTKDCPVGWRAVKRRITLVGAAAAAVMVAGFGLFTLGAFAASVRGNGNGGVGFVNPIARIRDWLFPPPPPLPLVAPVPAPNIPAVVMGKMCPPEIAPAPQDVLPKVAAPVQEVP